MGGSEDPENGSPALPSIVDREGLVHWFANKADLTNLVIMGARLNGASAQQAFFSGTIFRDCQFSGCDLRRAEFEATVFENCTFDACDFSIADFRSAEIARSSFNNCNFEQGSIKGASFIECALSNCNLFQQSFQDNRLERCVLLACHFYRSTSLHCRFVETTFNRTDLADCTALYHLFERCDFVESRVNAEFVGLSFGLTPANLHELPLTWLGEKLPPRDVDTETLISDLIRTYDDRGWPLPAAMTQLNFSLGSRLGAFNSIFRAIDHTSLRRPLIADEIQFVTEVVQLLAEARRLPFLAVVNGLEMVSRLTERRGGKDELPLRSLYHALKDAEHAQIAALDRFESDLSALTPGRAIEVQWVFSEEPKVGLDTWLQAAHVAFGLGEPGPQRTAVRQGSYIEVFWMLPATLACVVVALSMIARGIDQLIDIRARLGILLAASLPKPVRTRALQPLPTATPELLGQISTAMKIVAQPQGAQFCEHGQALADKLEKVITET